MRIVGSMTTIPERISKIKKVIQSILNQTRKLDLLYLNIPYISKKGLKYKIPYYLQDKEYIKINRCEDYGPITKLLPTLDVETDPETYIITFDDDRLVHKDVVKIIERKIKKYPDAVLSFSGWNVGFFPFYLQCLDNNIQDVEVDWVQGCHSITYPRKVINKNKYLESFPEISLLSKHDDHKLSAYLELQTVKKISINQL
jgi:hypothetical protein